MKTKQLTLTLKQTKKLCAWLDRHIPDSDNWTVDFVKRHAAVDEDDAEDYAKCSQDEATHVEVEVVDWDCNHDYGYIAYALQKIGKNTWDYSWDDDFDGDHLNGRLYGVHIKLKK